MSQTLIGQYLAELGARVIERLACLRTVSVQTVRIVEAMKAGPR